MSHGGFGLAGRGRGATRAVRLRRHRALHQLFTITSLAVDTCSVWSAGGVVVETRWVALDSGTSSDGGDGDGPQSRLGPSVGTTPGMVVAGSGGVDADVGVGAGEACVRARVAGTARGRAQRAKAQEAARIPHRRPLLTLLHRPRLHLIPRRLPLRPRHCDTCGPYVDTVRRAVGVDQDVDADTARRVA